MTRKLTFQHWTDPLCIWAFVAQDKLERLLAELGPCLHVEYRVVPVFGSVPYRFEHGAWSAEGVSGRVQKTREIAEKHGHPEVSGECWRVAQPASSWAPAAAIKAVSALESAGEQPSGTVGEYQRRLRSRFFVDAQNIALRSTQLSLAEEMEIPRAKLEQRLDDGRALAALWEDYCDKERLKLQGSPTYVLDDGRAMLYGNCSYGVLHATVEELLGGASADGSAC